MKSFLESMNFRHATKVFDVQSSVPDNQIKEIVNVGRLSPSSFGFEPWKFVVVSNNELKEALLPACFGQEKITTSSHVVIILSRRKDMLPNSEYLNNLLSKRMPKEGVEYVLSTVEKIHESFSEDKYDMWSKAQCYIAAANMMTYAASQGIDSCPMEGFNEKEVLKVLDYDENDYGVALVVPFGYRINEQGEKMRLPFEKVTDFRE